MPNPNYVRKPRTPEQMKTRAMKDKARHLRNKLAKLHKNTDKTPLQSQTEDNFMGTKWTAEEEREHANEMRKLYAECNSKLPAQYRINGGNIAVQKPVIQAPVTDTYLTYDTSKYNADINAQMRYARQNYNSHKYNQILRSLNAV